MLLRILGLSVLVGILIAGLIGCGPVYRTEFTYVPPDSIEGRQCTVQCANVRELCRSRVETRASREQAACQKDVIARQATCMAAARDDQERAKCRFSTTHCRSVPDTRQCDNEYNVCYETCGGRVDAYQVCVSGC